jgi:membrane fusion protein, peptide pheromone/bacteriocin exporter
VPAPLLPAELAGGTVEALLHRHSRGGAAIYLAVLLLVLAAVCSLPLVRVPITVAAGGIIRPAVEKHEVRAPASGAVLEVLTGVGKWVEPGHRIMALEAGPLEERRHRLAERAGERAAEIEDLSRLTLRTAAEVSTGLRTARYRAEAARFQDEMRLHRLREERAAAELERASALLARQLTAREEAESREHELRQLRSTGQLLAQRQHAEWQRALEAARDELRELRSQAALLARERAQRTVVSPVAGTVEELAPLSPGSWVQAGEVIAVVSPSAELLAELLVPPRRVGFVRPGMEVRLLLDAFPHGEWGHLAGRVSSMGDDFMVAGDQPMFRVRVRLASTQLLSRGGTRVDIHKGMTLTGRFLVAERTLAQLLRDRASDWLDPTGGRSELRRHTAR